MTRTNYAGGCLCGSVRYVAKAPPQYAGYCFCADCLKASGSGFMPFMGFAASDLTFTGEPRQFATKALRGGDAVRNFCPRCGSLVFGGIVGQDDSHTIYAGTLDDPSLFRPQIAIFGRNKPAWTAIPAGVTVFDEMPPG